MINENWVYSAWLSGQCGTGSAAPKKLYGALGTAENIYKCINFDGISLTEKQKARLLDKNLQKARYSVNTAINLGFRIITYNCPEYPDKLRKISNPPCLLYYKGNFPSFDNYYCVGVVGTRRPTINALDATYGMTEYLSKKGFIIISGLASGIDRESHIASINSGGFSAGISGVRTGKVYPRENRNIYNELYKNGVVISEYAPDSVDNKSNFPMRNRLITGLSDALLIMEAPIKSGAIITAEKALSEKRPVFVYPGDHIANEGGRLLFNKGAIPIIDAEEILLFFEEIGFTKKLYTVSPTLREAISTPREVASTLREEALFHYKKTRIASDTEVDENSPEVNDNKKTVVINTNDSIPKGLSTNEEAVYKYILEAKEASTDMMIANMGFSSSELLSCASMLEIYGYIKRLPGDKWCIL